MAWKGVLGGASVSCRASKQSRTPPQMLSGQQSLDPRYASRHPSGRGFNIRQCLLREAKLQAGRRMATIPIVSRNCMPALSSEPCTLLNGAYPREPCASLHAGTFVSLMPTWFPLSLSLTFRTYARPRFLRMPWCVTVGCRSPVSNGPSASQRRSRPGISVHTKPIHASPCCVTSRETLSQSGHLACCLVLPCTSAWAHARLRHVRLCGAGLE